MSGNVFGSPALVRPLAAPILAVAATGLAAWIAASPIAGVAVGILTTVVIAGLTGYRKMSSEDRGVVEGDPFPPHDIGYIWQAARARTPMVQFGNTRPRLDPAFPFQILHENLPPDELTPEAVSYRVAFGQPGTVRQYCLEHIVNASAMSLGGLNPKLIEAICRAQTGLGLVNTGEGGAAVHLATGADVVIQIGTAKFGLAIPVVVNGRAFAKLDLARLTDLVRAHDNVRLIELKISQGAKPGTVSLPASHVSTVVARARGVPVGHDAVSPPQHFELLAKTRAERLARLCQWIEEVRRATGLPVGIKMCIGKPHELRDMADSFARLGVAPDFITVDSAYGGTSNANACTANFVGYGDAYESLRLLDSTLREYGLRHRVVVCAAGGLHTPAYAIAAFAHGADVVFIARGLLYAAAAANGIRVDKGVSPFGLTRHDARALASLDLKHTTDGIRNYSTRFDYDVRLLTRLTGKSSPAHLDLGDLRPVALHEPDPLLIR